MNKKAILFSILIILVGIYSYIDLDMDSVSSFIKDNLDTGITGSQVTSFVQDDGNFNVYFCPHDNCEEQIVSFINTAKYSLDCALFEISLESIQDAILNKRAEGKQVRIVTDNDYLDEFNYSFVIFDGWGLMHNKFCIKDNKYVLTGSMNPTNNGANYNNNNLIIIESEILASNYQDEFEELHNETFKKGEPVLNSNIIIKDETYGEITIENYFCPEDNCAYHTTQAIREAKDSIYFMTFSFTHDGIENAILVKYNQGVDVKGVIEARGATKYSPYQVFNYQGIPLYKDNNSKTMHHKVFIIDEKTVVTGSFNPTSSGDKKNDENLLIIRNENVAKLYLEEFNYVFNQSIGD